MLSNFDKSVLDDSEFQEDAVREEIIAPILKRLGYFPSGENKVVRSRKLIHPFVSIGSKQTKVNIIPDYVLEVDSSPKVVIDAKSPHVSLQKSKHAEQAYSYAIHPEIRANIYSLCNGKEWIIWDVDKFEPVVTISIDELIKDCSIIDKFLHPSSVLYPEKREFHSDFGLRLAKMDMAEDTIQHFVANQIGNIGKVEDDLYTTSVVVDFGDEKLTLSFDMSKKIYTELLGFFPEETQVLISSALSRQPYSLHGFESILVTITGKFGSLQNGKYEDFIPIVVSEIKPLG